MFYVMYMDVAWTWYFYHRLRGSASAMLTATGLVNGRWRYSTPYRIDTP